MQTETSAPPPSAEAKEILEKADKGLKSLESDDASLSDMLTFSKQIQTGKTAEQEAKEKKEAEEAAIAQQILAQ